MHEARVLLECHLDAGCDVDARLNGSGDTALHLAVYNENTDLIRLFLDAACDVNAMCDGNAPLHIAILKENMQRARLLVDAKEVNNDDGLTSLHLAYSKGNMQLVKLLLRASCLKDKPTKNCHDPQCQAAC